MKVTGLRLELMPSLVRELEDMECDQHGDEASVHFIIGQDGTSAQWTKTIVCCEEFRSAVERAIETYIAKLPKTRLVRISNSSSGLPDMELFGKAVAAAGEVYCHEHGANASLDNLAAGTAAISGCCNRLLDQAALRLSMLR